MLLDGMPLIICLVKERKIELKSTKMIFLVLFNYGSYYLVVLLDYDV
jgi:hypothetical protein